MLFNIERDEGTQIVGYLVPDRLSGSSSLRITDGQRDLAVLPCQQEIPALVAAGRHTTGRCGFTIDETIIPDLSQQRKIELYDSETNIRIYRRLPADEAIPKRIFRLETHLVPLWRLDDSVEQRFQYFFKGTERYGLETSTQIFLLSNSSSLYLSGRLTFRTYEIYINEKVHCVTLLRDPHLELAERLLALRLVRKLKGGAQLLGARDLMTLGPAIEFAETIDNDEKKLHKAFASMPKAAIANLANPVTRLLAARSPDDMPRKHAVATALATLGRFSIVGLRERQDLFLAQLADLLGVSAELLPMVPDFSRSAELSERLRQVPEADVLIEQDLEVYQHVKWAIERAGVDDSEPSIRTQST
jgi:hypothetical protein